jgi:hypothetical protein
VSQSKGQTKREQIPDWVGELRHVSNGGPEGNLKSLRDPMDQVEEYFSSESWVGSTLLESVNAIHSASCGRETEPNITIFSNGYHI